MGEAMYTFSVSGEGVNAPELPVGNATWLMTLGLILILLGSRAVVRVFA